jgi:transcriptional regulator
MYVLLGRSECLGMAGMHNYSLFEMKEAEEKRAFINERRFANLIINGPTGLLAAHIPLMLLESDNGWVLEGHVARSNPLGAAAHDAKGLAIFNGADAYVAAGFYPSKKVHGKVAPTWNYQAVHAAGVMRTFFAEDALISHLVRLTNFLEADEPNPWAVEDSPDGFTENLVPHIIGFTMQVETLEGITKMNQNSRETDRLGVIEGLSQRNAPHEQPILDRMRENARKAVSMCPSAGKHG